MTEAAVPRANRRLNYSRFVAWAKVILPLAALGILSTIFLISHRIDPNSGIPFAEANLDVEALIRDQRITNPTYAGMTSDGTMITVAASTARPDREDPGHATADQVLARLEEPGGAETIVTAPTGVIDTGAKTLRLSGGVDVNRSDGYEMHAPTVTALFEAGEIDATGPVQGAGPLGTLQAGAMQLFRQKTGGDGGGENYRLVFTEGVRIVYQPKAPEERKTP